jgi:hypothetical protein
MISDRDRIFTSNLWKELFQLAGVNLHMSTTYHPSQTVKMKSDGQNERINQCLETYLRYFVQACPTKWRRLLALVEYWYNTSYHSSLQLTPFEVLYGHQPRQVDIGLWDTSEVPELQEWLQDRKLMVQPLQQQLLCAQQR